MGLILAPVYLFNLIIVFGGFLFASIAATIILFKFSKRLEIAVSLTLLGLVISYALASYMLNHLVAGLIEPKKVGALFAFALITWRADLLYLSVLAAVLFGFSYAYRFKSKDIFYTLIFLSLVLFYSGVIQACIGMFSAHDFFKNNGVVLTY